MNCRLHLADVHQNSPASFTDSHFWPNEIVSLNPTEILKKKYFLYFCRNYSGYLLTGTAMFALAVKWLRLPLTELKKLIYTFFVITKITSTINIAMS